MLNFGDRRIRLISSSCQGQNHGVMADTTSTPPRRGESAGPAIVSRVEPNNGPPPAYRAAPRRFGSGGGDLLPTRGDKNSPLVPHENTVAWQTGRCTCWVVVASSSSSSIWTCLARAPGPARRPSSHQRLASGGRARTILIVIGVGTRRRAVALAALLAALHLHCCWLFQGPSSGPGTRPRVQIIIIMGPHHTPSTPSSYRHHRHRHPDRPTRAALQAPSTTTHTSSSPSTASSFAAAADARTLPSHRHRHRRHHHRRHPSLHHHRPSSYIVAIAHRHHHRHTRRTAPPRARIARNIAAAAAHCTAGR